jgi:hypothetical protein
MSGEFAFKDGKFTPSDLGTKFEFGDGDLDKSLDAAGLCPDWFTVYNRRAFPPL